MNKEFIPHEQALELKELGFDEPCFSLYLDNDKKTMTSSMKGADTNSWLKKHYTGYGDSITAPLYQQAFRWFRDRHGLYADLFVDDDQTFGFCVSSFAEEGRCRVDKPIKRQFSTYEESELECIKFLIEIVERKPEAYS